MSFIALEKKLSDRPLESRDNLAAVAGGYVEVCRICRARGPIYISSRAQNRPRELHEGSAVVRAASLSLLLSEGKACDESPFCRLRDRAWFYVRACTPCRRELWLRKLCLRDRFCRACTWSSFGSKMIVALPWGSDAVDTGGRAPPQRRDRQRHRQRLPRCRWRGWRTNS